MEILNQSELKYAVIRSGCAEADDCVAVVCDHLLQRSEDVTVDVVTGDSDLY